MPNMIKPLIRVGIVDDHKATVSSLKEVLSYAPKIHVVLTARSGTELFDLLKKSVPESMPDVIITDVNMPGMSGIEVVRLGKALYPDIRFLMLTVFDDEDTLFEAIKAGASGYLLKNDQASAIVRHIEQLMEDGSVPMSSRIARKTLDLLAHAAMPVSGNQIVHLEGLSPREKDVLYLLVDGLEYKEIAARLNISPLTVRKHISNVYDKLHISSKAQAIRLMQGTIPALPSGKGKDYRILLVDDHQIILDSLAMMIGTIGNCEITGKISNPTEVIPFLTDHQVDLIISDISMPHMDGLQLASEVKRKFPAVRMLMLTVSEAPEQVQLAHSLGVEGYVLKKTNKEELTNAIRQIMSGESFYGKAIAAFV